MKKLYLEILIIVALSCVLALGFNFYRSKPLPLIYKETKPIELSEDELFGQNSTQNNTLIDTVKTENKDKIKDSIEKNTEIAAKSNINEQEIKEKIDKNLMPQVKIEVDNLGKTITYNQMLKIVDNSDFIVIDARSAEHYKKSHIGKAINIFPYDDEAVIMPKILNLSRDKKIVIYCDGGQCDSSHELAKMILNFGYKNVYIYSAGWEEWSKKNGN